MEWQQILPLIFYASLCFPNLPQQKQLLCDKKTYTFKLTFSAKIR